jgi:hypothetical protein
MTKTFEILYIILAVYTLIHNYREVYLSGFRYLNLRYTISITPTLIFFVIHLFFQSQIDSYIKENTLLGAILVLFIILLFIYPDKIVTPYFEKEKANNWDNWKKWEVINKNTTIIQKILFYYGVQKNNWLDKNVQTNNIEK